ncbi:hypothetical protein AB0C38_31905 [Amycolatopsis sp. NPDC048633]|uniref:hypothetical protein n=1 Tax=Amycolatopsis sp. NPDC048633 TaxID=3157095 RepID=UPI003407A0C2
MSWYVARSLDVLLGQLNAKAPNRSKVSDGSIGDASHSARESDHNPTSTGQVCARDFTNDPMGGLAGQWLADVLVASRDPRIKYVIFNHRIIDSRAGQHSWQWMPYSGANAHEHHVHVSVFAGALGDRTDPWNLGGGTKPSGRQLLNGDTHMKLPAEPNTRSEVIALPPDADVKLIFAAKTVIFGGHIYCWSAVPGQGTGGDPVQWRTEIKEGEVISIPRGTTKAEISYSCASEIDLYVQAIV